jgi:NADPH:quinone reductase
MKAIVCREYGQPEDLIFDELPSPTPGPGQITVRVRAASVNFPDVLLIGGKYQVRIPVPFTPGSELAGEVLAVGDEVSGFQEGDRVSATVMVGAFAEEALVDASSATAIPEGIDFAEAAAFGVTNRTAYHALRSIAQVQPGDWVVVLGAAGGVGLAAVDIAVALGARVLAAASSPAKLELCRERGAEACVDYDREDLRARIRDITGKGGAQVVIDPVGGPYSEPALRSLGRRSTFVTLGYAAGPIPAIPLNLVMLKGITVRGMEMRTFATDYPQEAARDDAELAQLFSDGRIRPYIGARFGLQDAASALRLVADRKAMGKVIIDVD